MEICDGVSTGECGSLRSVIPGFESGGLEKGKSFFGCQIASFHVRFTTSVPYAMQARPVKSNFRGVSFRRISIQYAMQYSQKYTPPH